MNLRTACLFLLATHLFIGCSDESPTGGASAIVISGTVTGADSVTVTLSGDSSSVQTVRDGGTYAFTVAPEGTYSVRPAKSGYEFSPVSRTFTAVTTDQTQDFTASEYMLAGKIAFMSSRDGFMAIHVMDADGSTATRLTTSELVGVYPAWSPDGSKIAFIANGEIHVMNADGSGVTRLTNNSHANSHPAWSPDGSKIAFDSYRDDHYGIYAMNADGTGEAQLSADGDISPSWSPDGSKIAFYSYRDSTATEIYTMNADGSNPIRITNDSYMNTLPVWSPDGTRIAFISFRNSRSDLYTMDTTGGGLTFVIDDAMFPSWSPDGTRIAFSSSRTDPPGSEIYVVTADGSGLTRLTASAGSNTHPVWSE